MRGRIGESSRDSPKDNSSGLKPMKEPSVLADSTRCDVEKESEGRDTEGRSRVGSFSDTHAGERGATAESIF